MTMMGGGEGLGLGCAGFELCGVHADGKGPGGPSVLGLFVSFNSVVLVSGVLYSDSTILLIPQCSS